MNHELLQKICDRAGELSEKGIRELRLLHPDNLDGTTSGVQWLGIPKRKLVADILFDEIKHSFGEVFDS